jgi:hypothetical protein
MNNDFYNVKIKAKRDEKGLVSIMVVTLVIIILTLMTTGFAKVMDRELRQSLDRELAVQANYAAESGMNDARNYAANVANTADTGGNCIDTANLTAAQIPYFTDKGSISSGAGDLVQYTCINIDTNPHQLNYDISAGQSKVFKVITTDVLSNLYFSWNNKGATASTVSTALPGLGTFPTESYFLNAANLQATGVLRATIFPVTSNAATTTAGDQNTTLESLGRNYFLFPNGAGGIPGTADFKNDNGISVPGNCNQLNYTDAAPSALPYKGSKHFCNVRISNLVTPVSAPSVDLQVNGASSATINSGDSVNLTWTSSNATVCKATTQSNPPIPAGWTGAQPTSSSGPVTISNIQKSTYFIISCAGPGGGVNDYVSVGVLEPSPPTKVYNVMVTADDGVNDIYINGTLVSLSGNSGWDYPKTGTVSLTSPPQEFALKANNDCCFAPTWSGNPAMAIFAVTDPSTGATWYSDSSRNFVGLAQPPARPAPAGWPSPDTGIGGWGTVSYQSYSAPSWGFDWGPLLTSHGWPAGAGNFMWPDNGIGDANAANRIAYFYGGSPPSPIILPYPALALPPVPPAASDTFYYVQLTALYKDLTVSVQGSNISNNSLTFKKAQAELDVTAKANDILKRLHTNIPLEPDYDYPEFAVQSMNTLCKRIRLPQERASTDPRPYGNAGYDDSDPGNSYVGPECSAGTNAAGVPNIPVNP